MAFNPNQKLTRELVKKLPPLCTDGAWGTELAKLGRKAGELSDLWNLNQADKVFAVAKSYVDSGSHIILTNTFSGNRVTLEKHGIADKVTAINKAGAEISKKAAHGKAYVFASLGPTGKLVMIGEVTPEAVEEAFAEQAAALEAGGADALCVETQADLEEARAAIKGCLKGSKLPVGVSFSFDSGKDKTATMMGVTPAQAYAMAVENGASFVGANCGLGIESYIPVARLFQACGTELPIWIKGNAGKPEVDDNGNTVYRGSPALFANAVKPLLDAGVRFIGGCCGSTPVHIRAMAQALAKVK
ncbi:MAG TPA: homocysteine S-methyltransferase family protein [Planctomycetota bacterium]|jgi:methionine synthase I (cobalamin-dependent)